MLYDVTSDVHVEQWNPPWPIAKKKGVKLDWVDWEVYRHPGSRLLIMAGDTSNDAHTTIRVAKDAAEFYEWVLVVDGNHEHYMNKHYKRETDGTCKYMRDACAEHGRLIFLDGHNNLLVDGTLFIGANGWYSFIMPQYDRETCHWRWKRESNDGRYIRFHRYPDKLALYHAQLLEVQVAMAQENPAVERIVVVTHTVPFVDLLNRRLEDHAWEQLSGAYWNAFMQRVLNADKNGKLLTWHFGHTHWPIDKMHQGVRFVGKPRGYPGDRMNADRRWSGPLQMDTDDKGLYSAFGEIER